MSAGEGGSKRPPSAEGEGASAQDRCDKYLREQMLLEMKQKEKIRSILSGVVRDFSTEFEKMKTEKDKEPQSQLQLQSPADDMSKKRTVDGFPGPSTIPFKKRKISPSSDNNRMEEEKELPEWFKISVQLLLINFYPDGVALVNTLQSDYEALYPKTKVINCQEYGFLDWEKMLRSQQFKKHCTVYDEQKATCCKGLPLSRATGGIIMKNGSWEIVPRSLNPREEVQSKRPPEDVANTKKKILQKGKQRITASRTCPSTASAASKQHVCASLPGNVQNTSNKRVHPQNDPAETTRARGPTKKGPGTSKKLKGNAISASANGPSKSRESLHVQKIIPTKDKKISEAATKSTAAERKGPEPPPQPTASTANSSKNLDKKRPESTPQPKDTPPTNCSRPSSLQIPKTDINPINSHDASINAKAGASVLTKEMPTIASPDTPPENVVENKTMESNQGTQHIPTQDQQSSNFQSNISSEFFRRSNCPPSYTHADIREEITGDRKIATVENVLANESDSKPTKENSPQSPRLSPEVDVNKGTCNKSYSQASKLRNNSPPRDPREIYISKNKHARSITRRVSLSTTLLADENSDLGDELSPASTSSEIVEETWSWSCPAIVLKKEFDKHHLQELEDSILKGILQNPQEDPRFTSGYRSAHLKNAIEKKMSESNESEKSESPKLQEEYQTEDEILDDVSSDGEKKTNDCQSQSSQNPMEQSIVKQQCTQNDRELEEKPKQSSADTSLGKHVLGSDKLVDIELPIPQDDFDIKTLRCDDLWRDVVWNRGYRYRDSNPILSAHRFFNSDAYGRWIEAKRCILTNQQRNQLTAQIGVYEHRKYPSNCEYYFLSSLRMVEVDYKTGGQFSSPTDDAGNPLVGKDDILYYVDFAGSNTGVFEFYNKKRPLSSKGFGITYRKRPYKFNPDSAYPEFFEAFYGVLNSYNGEGSMANKHTVDLFLDHVLQITEGRGVEIVSTLANIAHVPFDDGADQNWKFQNVAQVMVTLMVLREGGHLALKMYDLKQPFTVGLVYILFRCFRSVRICKLDIFAPASCERAIICLGKKSSSDCAEFVEFLKQCHQSLTTWHENRERKRKRRENGNGRYNGVILDRRIDTIEELIPYHNLKKHEDFMEYIRESNDRLKKAQLEEFLNCIDNMKGRSGSIFSSKSFRELVMKTTEKWKVPKQPKRDSSSNQEEDRSPDSAFRKLNISEDSLVVTETVLNEYNLYQIFPSAENWRFCPVGTQSKTRGFYMGFEGKPYFFNTTKRRFIPLSNYHEFRLPSNTLVYAEIVPLELVADDNDGTPCEFDDIFSIIDGYILCGVEIGHLPYESRIRECSKFAKGITSVFFPRMLKATVTKSFDLDRLPDLLKTVTSCRQTLRLPAPQAFNLDNRFEFSWFPVSGLLFFENQETSRTHLDVMLMLTQRVYWEWAPGMDIPLLTLNDQDCEDHSDDAPPIGSVSARKVVSFVNQRKV